MAQNLKNARISLFWYDTDTFPFAPALSVLSAAPPLIFLFLLFFFSSSVDPVLQCSRHRTSPLCGLMHCVCYIAFFPFLQVSDT